MRWCNLFAAAISALLFLTADASSQVNIEKYCPKCNKSNTCGYEAMPVLVAQHAPAVDVRDIESLDEFSTLLDHEIVGVDESAANNHWLKPVQHVYIILVSILSGILSLLLFPEGRMVLILLAVSHFFTLIGFYLINLMRR